MITGFSTVDIFTGNNMVGSPNYMYTTARATTSSDGWVTVPHDEVQVQLKVATLTDSKIYFRIEGRNNAGTNNLAGSIYATSYTAKDNISKFITVTPKVKQIRVGVKTASRIASPNNIYCSLLMTDKR